MESHKRCGGGETPGNLPGSLAGIRAMDVTQLAQTEAVTSRRVHVTVHRHDRAAGGHLEHLAHLNVHFKIGDGAPELGSCPNQNTERRRGELKSNSALGNQRRGLRRAKTTQTTNKTTTKTIESTKTLDEKSSLKSSQRLQMSLKGS